VSGQQIKLTDEQQRMLDGTAGEVAQRLMRLLVRLGQVYGADRMVQISSAQISGVSYKSIGDPGLEFLEDVACKGVRVQVQTTLNPAGMDLEDWRSLGFPADFAERQQRIIAAFESMGVVPTATCTPYLAGNRPGRGDHIAWAESSAVSFANSVLGAYTNREGGPSALAAAVCGCTPLHGLHLLENRRPTIRIAVEVELGSRADFGALGIHVGRLVRDGIPYFTGLRAHVDQLKALGAAMAASGAVALYHVEGLTPEADQHEVDTVPTLTVTREEIDEAYRRLNTGGRPDLVCLGCPHASLDEIAEVADRLQGRRVSTPLWVCTSRAVRNSAAELGLVEVIEQAGGRVVADTCMVVAPMERMGVGTTAVDSGKAAHYLPGMCQQQVVFSDWNTLLEEVLS